jgi:hypothetical protein
LLKPKRALFNAVCLRVDADLFFAMCAEFFVLRCHDGLLLLVAAVVVAGVSPAGWLFTALLPFKTRIFMFEHLFNFFLYAVYAALYSKSGAVQRDAPGVFRVHRLCCNRRHQFSVFFQKPGMQC